MKESIKLFLRSKGVKKEDVFVSNQGIYYLDRYEEESYITLYKVDEDDRGVYRDYIQIFSTFNKRSLDKKGVQVYLFGSIPDYLISLKNGVFSYFIPEDDLMSYCYFKACDFKSNSFVDVHFNYNVKEYVLSTSEYSCEDFLGYNHHKKLESIYKGIKILNCYISSNGKILCVCYYDGYSKSVKIRLFKEENKKLVFKDYLVLEDEDYLVISDKDINSEDDRFAIFDGTNISITLFAENEESYNEDLDISVDIDITDGINNAKIISEVENFNSW